MKKALLPLLAASALILSSCATTQLAKQTDSNDDVYNTTAQAKVITPPVAKPKNEPEQKSYKTEEQLYGDNYSNRNYDDTYWYGYASRINRFYYNSPWNSYYDYSYGYNPWYTYQYDPFFYDPWSFRPGISIYLGNRYSRNWNSYNYGYNNFGYNNYGYNRGYWGPYSYYNTYPGYYGSGRYYSDRGSYDRQSSPRPNREAGMGRGARSIDNTQSGGATPSNGRPSRGASDNTTPRISSDQPSSGSSRPSRGAPDNASPKVSTEQPSSGSSRPSREVSEPRQSAPRQEAPSRPERTYSPPPSSSGSSGSSSGGSSSSGGNSGSSRPSRGGR